MKLAQVAKARRDKGKTCNWGCLVPNPCFEPPGFNSITFSHPQIVGVMGRSLASSHEPQCRLATSVTTS